MTDSAISSVPVTQWAALVPELMCADLPRSLAFYTELLGFTLHYTRPGFAYLSKGAAQVMLEQAHDEAGWLTAPLAYPFGRGINFQLEVGDLDAIHARLLAQGVPLRVPLHTATYLEGEQQHHQRQFLIQDPDGYLWRCIDSEAAADG